MAFGFASISLNFEHGMDVRRRAARKMLRGSLAVLTTMALAGALCGVAHAETKYGINPANSKVTFSLGGFHEVNGIFKVGSGEVTFDRKTGAMTGSIVVEADSGNSGNHARDKKMKGSELHVKKFPSITFSPKQFTGDLKSAGTSTLQVHGVFTLIGKPHKVAVPMTVTIHGNECTAKGSFTIPYVSWGMKDPTMLFMKEAKDVKVNLVFKGKLSH